MGEYEVSCSTAWRLGRPTTALLWARFSSVNTRSTPFGAPDAHVPLGCSKHATSCLKTCCHLAKEFGSDQQPDHWLYIFIPTHGTTCPHFDVS